MVANQAVNIFNDNAMSHFRKILQRRQKQLTLDRFLVKEKRKATAEKDSTELKRQRREKTPEGQLPSHFMRNIVSVLEQIGFRTELWNELCSKTEVSLYTITGPIPARNTKLKPSKLFK